MASTTKKGSRTTKSKPRRLAVKTSQPKQAQNIQSLKRALDESLVREAATSDILRMIASSPANLQSVLDGIAERAAKLCAAENASIFRVDDNFLRVAAQFGRVPMAYPLGGGPIIDRGAVNSRVVMDRQTIHVKDLAAAEAEFPLEKDRGIAMGIRTMLATPLLRDGVAIGTLAIRRTEVRPFTDTQVKLLKSFADQAVIAIENTRLFEELTQKTADLETTNSELREALEQQTATSEILRVIASSPTDIQPVLDAVTESAVKLAGAKQGHIRQYDGEFLRLVASYGESPEQLEVFQAPVRPRPESRSGRAFLERKPIHTLDAQVERHTMAAQTGARTALAVPLLREDSPIGVFTIWRDVVEPFTDRQIELVKTFADQAVVAIENVRLFKEIQERNAELREALEHQTATSEVLGIISRSPTDVQPVLDAIVESAARVCGVDDVLLRLREGDVTVPRAHFGSMPVTRPEASIDEPQFRWMREHGALHIPDVREQNDFPTFGTFSGSRTYLMVPLRQQGELIGNLAARRTEVHPFTSAQIKLLETFADQAVIAIENVRLFQELKESLEQQTATSGILGVIANSPTDIRPVLDAVAESAARVCGSYDAVIRLLEGNILRLAAHYGPVEPGYGLERPLGGAVGKAVLERKTIQIPDTQAESEGLLDNAPIGRNEVVRTLLVTPLLREGTAIGVINIRRIEVKPFTDKQVALLETFADQAVIAIENVRLFRELQERNAELREALEHQTATSEVLGIISRSPTDVQPVL